MKKSVLSMICMCVACVCSAAAEESHERGTIHIDYSNQVILAEGNIKLTPFTITFGNTMISVKDHVSEDNKELGVIDLFKIGMRLGLSFADRAKLVEYLHARGKLEGELVYEGTVEDLEADASFESRINDEFWNEIREPAIVTGETKNITVSRDSFEDAVNKKVEDAIRKLNITVVDVDRFVMEHKDDNWTLVSKRQVIPIRVAHFFVPGSATPSFPFEENGRVSMGEPGLFEGRVLYRVRTCLSSESQSHESTYWIDKTEEEAPAKE